MLTKGMLVHSSLLVAAALLGTLLTGAVYADDSKLVSFSELRVMQFYGPGRDMSPLERRYPDPAKDNAELWAVALVLPMPPMLKRLHASPRSVVAVAVKEGEVGDPGTFAKLASSFLDTESADLTDVLVTAAKEKWGPKED